MCQSSDKSDLSDLSDKSDILCPQYWLCAMRPASQQNTQPCAFDFPRRMAHREPKSYSVLIRTSPYPSSLRYAVASRHRNSVEVP